MSSIVAIDRRSFVGGCGALASLLAAHPVLGQCVERQSRAAVVIGVNKTGNLPQLSAAASSAKQFSAWLCGEGFEVHLFVDDSQPVVVRDIFNAVSALVNRGTIEQLVVYFSGHGFLKSQGSEFWMLSEAPDNPNEAVSLVESAAVARAVGISNVVFISDACRSLPDSMQANGVRGSLIFPNPPSTAQRGDVDKFLATLPGDAAFELPVTTSTAEYEAIYTSCFLDAFTGPEPSMVQELPDGLKVVPNRNLKSYLAREVRRRVEARNIKLRQIPDAEIMSDNAYIGRALAGRTTVSAQPRTSVIDMLNRQLTGVGIEAAQPPQTMAARDMLRVSRESQLFTRQTQIVDAMQPTRFETGSGINLFGAALRDVAVSPGWRSLLSNDVCHACSPASRVQLFPQTGATFASVALRFDDGGGTVIAGLAGYVANIVVSQGVVRNVSYVPSPGTPQGQAYSARRAEVDQLHAVVGSAGQFSGFRIEGPRQMRNAQASALMERIKITGRIDPTLGIYAAYAYANADLQDILQELDAQISGELGFHVFDIAMLTRRYAERGSNILADVVPLCPMLSQGWSWLRVKGVQLPADIDFAQDHLRGSLWTTIQPAAMPAIMRAVSTPSINLQ